MPRTRSHRQQNRRFDTLIALPLARFRTAVAALPLAEVEALARRIELNMVEQRWALGGHGLARHRAPRQLGLLARRLAATRETIAARPTAAAMQLRLLEPVSGVPFHEEELAEAA